MTLAVLIIGLVFVTPTTKAQLLSNEEYQEPKITQVWPEFEGGCIAFYHVSKSNYNGAYALSHGFATIIDNKYEVICGYNSPDNISRNVTFLISVRHWNGTTGVILNQTYFSRSIAKSVVDLTCGQYIEVTISMVVNGSGVTGMGIVAEASFETLVQGD